MNLFQIPFDSIYDIITPLAIFAGIIAIGFIIRKLLYRGLSRWAHKTSSSLDNIVIGAAKWPSIFWILIVAIYLGLRFSILPQQLVNISGKVLLVLAILSITIFLADLAVRLIQSYATRVGAALPMSSLTQNMARAVIIIIGVLVILASLGALGKITPILATLGIGALAIALALQDTLSNLFAGFYIAISRQIRIGDFIKLDSGEEGYVTDIHWRTTKIRMLSNNIVLIPNERLAKAVVVNYYLPDKETAVLVNLGVHYKSDLRKVERVTTEVAREVMKEVPGGVPEFEPFIRYNSFADSSIGFTVIMRAKEVVDQYLIKHEFIKRLHERYQAEGIVIPYPIRAVNYEQEKENPPEQKSSDAGR